MKVEQSSLFKVYGTGEIGLKAKDLEKHRDVLVEAGFNVLGGWVIATDLFDAFCQKNSLTKESTLTNEAELVLPEGLWKINEDLLRELEAGRPYLLRSSANSDQGGIGIYKSVCFVPTGEVEIDLARIRDCEIEVFKSEFSDDAKAWRTKTDLPFGMAILVQPVIGKNITGAGVFMPVAAGTAFTNYDGKPLVRLNVGLGVSVVKGFGEKFVDFDNGDLGLVYNYADGVTAVDLEVQVFLVVGASLIGYERFSSQVKSSQLFPKLEELAKHGNFYLEIVLHDEKVYAVQCTAYKPLKLEPISFTPENMTLLASSKDIVNHGRKTGRGVVWAGQDGWPQRASEELHDLNRELKDHIVIVPQIAFTGAYQSFQISVAHEIWSLNYAHFSNAAGLVEMQFQQDPDDRMEYFDKTLVWRTDHTGLGATHFQQLCQRSDILFLGAEFDNDLPKIKESVYNEEGIVIWDVSYEMINDLTTGEGRLYIGKDVHAPEFSRKFVDELTDKIHEILRDIEKNEPDRHGFAVDLGNLMVALPFNKIIGFDPYELRKEDVEKTGLEKMRSTIEKLLEIGFEYFDPYDWDEYEEYFKKLYAHLAS